MGVRRLIVVIGVVLLAATAVLGCGGSDSPQPPRTTLTDCRGEPHLEPREFVFACADDGTLVNHIHWTAWGEEPAYGRGMARSNTCTPDCAAGNYKLYKVVLIANDRKPCHGTLAYSHVHYGFVGPSPFPSNSSGSANPTISHGCSKSS